MSDPILEVRDLAVGVTAQPEVQIVKGVDLEIRPGEVHALMGPNGSGKSTLANAIAGSPGVQVVQRGSVLFKGEDVTDAAPRTSARGWGCSSPSSTRRRFPA